MSVVPLLRLYHLGKIYRILPMNKTLLANLVTQLPGDLVIH